MHQGHFEIHLMKCDIEIKTWKVHAQGRPIWRNLFLKDTQHFENTRKLEQEWKRDLRK